VGRSKIDCRTSLILMPGTLQTSPLLLLLLSHPLIILTCHHSMLCYVDRALVLLFYLLLYLRINSMPLYCSSIPRYAIMIPRVTSSRCVIVLFLHAHAPCASSPKHLAYALATQTHTLEHQHVSTTITYSA